MQENDSTDFLIGVFTGSTTYAKECNLGLVLFLTYVAYISCVMIRLGDRISKRYIFAFFAARMGGINFACAHSLTRPSIKILHVVSHNYSRIWTNKERYKEKYGKVVATSRRAVWSNQARVHSRS